ncbi:hypothetical protein O7626_28670 [Micromonospora sp. WMMD1102]|nr:hypothetical protein [Micromonospora sp. WMMD1102]MDG4789854.1 hypothetical protein [Micromonospora sp. WMMD1102]
MKAHRTDGVSLTFALIFLGVAGWWLFAQLMHLALPAVGWLIAGGLILVGTLGLVGAIRANRSGRRPATTPATAGPGSPVATGAGSPAAPADVHPADPGSADTPLGTLFEQDRGDRLDAPHTLEFDRPVADPTDRSGANPTDRPVAELEPDRQHPGDAAGARRDDERPG